MPELNGIAATARILDAAGADAPAVLVLTTLRSDDAVAAATRAGAARFLLKDTTAETVVDALDPLTRRERQVFL